MDVLRGEVEQMGKSHQNIAGQMKTELEEPLAAFAGAMKERRKIVQNGIEKLLKVKVQQTQQVNKVFCDVNIYMLQTLNSVSDPGSVRARMFENQGLFGSRTYGYGTRREKEQGEARENTDQPSYIKHRI